MYVNSINVNTGPGPNKEMRAPLVCATAGVTACFSCPRGRGVYRASTVEKVFVKRVREGNCAGWYATPLTPDALLYSA